MEPRSRVETITTKPYQFTRSGVVVKKSPKRGYVLVRFDGDQHNTSMPISGLKPVDQLAMEVPENA